MSNTQELIPVEKRYDDVDLSADYVESRIKYPKFVFETVLEYVGCTGAKPAKKHLAVDAGCGPGLMSTAFLAPYFDRVIGVDISATQIQEAKLHNKHENIEYRLAPAESLPIEDNSVTLIQVATALHWFDHEKFYRECDRVLVPGGVIAAFSYSLKDFFVFNHPNSDKIYRILTEMTDKFASKSENPYFTKHCEWVLRRYTDPILQIPYKEHKRVDGQYMSFSSTISGVLRCLMTADFVRRFVNLSEKNQFWWKNCQQRLMDAYGTDNPEAPLTYKMEVFMILGRKPAKQ